MWTNNCLFTLLILASSSDALAENGAETTHTGSALRDLKEELRKELLADIREEIRTEVQAQLKGAVKDELASMLRDAVLEPEDEAHTGDNQNGRIIVTLVKEVLQNELAAGALNRVLDDVKQVLPEILASTSADSNSSRTADVKHRPGHSQTSRQLRRWQARRDESESESESDSTITLLPRASLTIKEVAFNVYLSQIKDHIPHMQTIKFDRILINEGNFYNVHTGVFTAPISGVYLFHYEFLGWSRETELSLMLDNTVASTANVQHINEQSYLVKASSMTLIQVQSGQSVWVTTHTKDDGNIISTEADKSSAFMGILMY